MAKARLNREARREVRRAGKEGRRCLRSICNETEKMSAASFAFSPFLLVVQQATAHSHRNLACLGFSAATGLFFPPSVRLSGEQSQKMEGPDNWPVKGLNLAAETARLHCYFVEPINMGIADHYYVDKYPHQSLKNTFNLRRVAIFDWIDHNQGRNLPIILGVVG